jgi:hypothetical protein
VKGARLLAWLALLVAFSPVVLELFRHLGAQPWARYVLIFAPLLTIAIVTSRDRVQPSSRGYVLLSLAIVFEFVALRGNLARFARPTFALGAIGLCQVQGLAPVRAAALALWLTPVPSFANDLGLQTALLGVAIPLARLFGAELSFEESTVVAPSGVLEVLPSDGGLPLAALFSGLAWYASVRAGASLPATAIRAITWSAVALPVQVAVMLAALAALAAGSPGAARSVLDHVGVVAALAGFAWIELRLCAQRRSESPGESGKA